MSRTAGEIGRAGEEFAASYLSRDGYTIVARNWRIRGGEIDIVALDGDTLVFVEVKVRQERGSVLAESTVDHRKLGRIMLAAEYFVYEHEEFLDNVWRVDLIAITMSRTGAVRGMQHYQNLTDD